MFAAACSSSVDLPMPGSPPRSTSDPARRRRRGRDRTRRCRSTAARAARSRCRRTARRGRRAGAARSDVRRRRSRAALPARRSSTSEFHAPQSAQRAEPLSAPARRIPGRRRRSSAVSYPPSLHVDYQLTRYRHCSIRDPARRRRSPRGSCRSCAAISRTSMRSSPCDADDHDLVARRDVQAGDVGDQHVHADRADDRRAAAADQHRAAAGEAQIEAVRVAGRHDRDRRRPIGGEPRAVADDLARRACLSPRRRGCASVMTGVSGSVDASGGGTMPYSSRPGRTRSYHTRESRSSAALFAAWIE